MAVTTVIERMRYKVLTRCSEHLVLKRKIPLARRTRFVCKALGHVVKRRKMLYFNWLAMALHAASSEDNKKILKYRLVSKRAKMHSDNYSDMLKASIKRTAADSLCQILSRIFLSRSIGKQPFMLTAFNQLRNVFLDDTYRKSQLPG